MSPNDHIASALGTLDFTLKSDKPMTSVQVKISTVNDSPPVAFIPYTTNKIFVSNVSGQKIQCFVSKFSGDGSDAWYNIGSNFENHGWSRSAWEVVVFKNEPDTKRVGFYLNNTKRTTKITFRSFTEVDIAHSE